MAAPRFAELITFDQDTNLITIDGDVFPWHIAEGGVSIDNLGSRNLPTVTLTLVCGNVAVSPRSVANHA